MKALLLDLDDTLLDYSGGVDQSWEAAVGACSTPDVEAGTLVAAIAETRRWFWDDPERHRRERVHMLAAWEHIVEFALERLGVSADGLAPAIARDYALRRRAVMRLFPDTIESLERLRQDGVPLGLVTNGDATQQRDKIERYGLAGFFSAILIEGEFGTGKPDVTVYRHVLRALGAEPDEAWMTSRRPSASGSAAPGWIVRGAACPPGAPCGRTESSARSPS